MLVLESLLTLLWVVSRRLFKSLWGLVWDCWSVTDDLTAASRARICIPSYLLCWSVHMWLLIHNCFVGYVSHGLLQTCCAILVSISLFLGLWLKYLMNLKLIQMLNSRRIPSSTMRTGVSVLLIHTLIPWVHALLFKLTCVLLMREVNVSLNLRIIQRWRHPYLSLWMSAT
jgi:hypothetical protein